MAKDLVCRPKCPPPCRRRTLPAKNPKHISLCFNSKNHSREIEEHQRTSSDDGAATVNQQSFQSAAAAGGMWYVGGEELIIEENDSDFWCIFVAEEQIVRLGHDRSDIAALWYKDPAIEDLSLGLMMFLDDKNALKMCRIAAERGHVEMFVVHQDGPEEGFPEIGYIDVGGDLPEGNGEDGHNERGGDEGPEPEGQNEEGGDAEAPPDGQNQDLGDVEAPTNGQIEAPVVEATASIDEGDVAASDQVAPMFEAGLCSGEAKSNLEGDQNAEDECANREGILAPPTKKAKGPSSSNGKAKTNAKSATRGKDKALSQAPPKTSNKKRKAAVVASSSQPPPTTANSNQILKRA
ncbi:hypothetical protein PIB30_076586 [Stylosanthes scabra]|uniref:PB1-like domain-containing protein n=1 Tax=Stylosanthes scabra TaxID=79078 RepID=A0ABU6YNH7_9FABA|nr:hypothetical protein [Stylosanthes scabra]